MEPYDALPEPDPYSVSRSAFKSLVRTLAGASCGQLARVTGPEGAPRPRRETGIAGG